MSDIIEDKTPIWFWVVSAIMLIWNILGVLAFFAQMAITPEIIAQMPDAERALYESTPAWVNIAFAAAVFGGAIGCVLLLLRYSLAIFALIIS